MFSFICSATIKDLTIKGVTINSTGYNTSTSFLNIGALAGDSDKGVVDNCHVYGDGSYKTITAVSHKNTFVGGLIGNNGSKTQNCTVNNINMTVSSHAGGIAGGNSLNKIIDCSVSKVCITYVWNTENACLGGVVGLNGPGGYGN